MTKPTNEKIPQPLLNEDPTIQRGYQGDPSKNCLCPAPYSAWHGYSSLMDRCHAPHFLIR